MHCLPSHKASGQREAISKVLGGVKTWMWIFSYVAVGRPHPHVAHGQLHFLVLLQKEPVCKAGDVRVQKPGSLILQSWALRVALGRGYEGTKPHWCLNLSQVLCPRVSNLRSWPQSSHPRHGLNELSLCRAEGERISSCCQPVTEKEDKRARF